MMSFSSAAAASSPSLGEPGRAHSLPAAKTLAPQGQGQAPEHTLEDLRNYGRLLGMDVDKDKDLSWIARQDYITPLPKAWEVYEVETEEHDKTGGGRPYYFNHETGESRWDDPIDTQFRQLFETERQKKTRRASSAVLPTASSSRTGEATPTTVRRPLTPERGSTTAAAGTSPTTRGPPLSPRTTRTFALRAARVKTMQDSAATAAGAASSSFRTPSISLPSSSFSSSSSCGQFCSPSSSSRPSTIKRAASEGRQATGMGIGPILAKTSAASLLSSIFTTSGGGTTTIKATTTPTASRSSSTTSSSSSGITIQTKCRGDAGIYSSSSMAALLTGGLSSEGGERGGYHQTIKKQVSLSISSSSNSKAAAGEGKGDGISLPETTRIKKRVSGRETQGAEEEEEEENKDTSNTCGSSHAQAQTQAEAEAVVTRALLEKARLASVRLSSESTLLEMQLEELKVRRDRLQEALHVAQGRRGGGGREGRREEEEARRMRGMQVQMVELMRAKERAEEERDKLKKDAAMHQSMLAASMKSTNGGLAGNSSSPPSFSPAHSSTTTTCSSSSSSSTAAAVVTLNKQLQDLTQENEALSSQLLAAQLLRRQELQEQQQQQQQQQQLGSPLHVLDMQHRLGQLQQDKEALLHEQKRLLKNKARSDAQLLTLLAQVREREGAIAYSKAASLGLPPTPRSPSGATATPTPPAKKTTPYSPLSAASSPSTVLAALNRRMKGQQTSSPSTSSSTSSPSASCPAPRQLQQLETALLESNQLKAELNENKRLLDLLKRKMMRDEEEAEEGSHGGRGVVGDSSEESESGEDGENLEEEESVLIQED